MMTLPVLLLDVNPVFAGRGCCSSHGGVSGCSGAKLRCNDGTISPTCSCDQWTQQDKEKSSYTDNDRPTEGRDYYLKPGANVKNLDPRIDPALKELGNLWREMAGDLPTINHGEDGIHKDKNKPGTDCSTYGSCVKTSGSRHYDHLAVDLDTQKLSGQQLKDLKKSLMRTLDQTHFWWQVEDPGTDNEHLHIQYNPQPGEKLPLRKK